MEREVSNRGKSMKVVCLRLPPGKLCHPIPCPTEPKTTVSLTQLSNTEIAELVSGAGMAWGPTGVSLFHLDWRSESLVWLQGEILT